MTGHNIFQDMRENSNFPRHRDQKECRRQNVVSKCPRKWTPWGPTAAVGGFLYITTRASSGVQLPVNGYQGGLGPPRDSYSLMGQGLGSCPFTQGWSHLHTRIRGRVF